jgi:hypothetical protein
LDADRNSRAKFIKHEGVSHHPITGPLGVGGGKGVGPRPLIFARRTARDLPGRSKRTIFRAHGGFAPN